LYERPGQRTSLGLQQFRPCCCSMQGVWRYDESEACIFATAARKRRGVSCWSLQYAYACLSHKLHVLRICTKWACLPEDSGSRTAICTIQELREQDDFSVPPPTLRSVACEPAPSTLMQPIELGIDALRSFCST
jgi:hypothetical protein